MDLKKCSIGFEFGSTRIKAVVIDPAHEVIASSEYTWENQFVNGVWTYSMDKVEEGMHTCFAGLLKDFETKHHQKLTTCGAFGVSGMMHGYLVLDKDDHVLAPFRTWRNTMTEEAAKELAALFGFSIPQRWSIAHVYQSLLNGAPEVKDIAYSTTLAGYVHYMLTGRRMVGVGEGSGMFPIDPRTNSWDEGMLEKFDRLVEGKVPWKVKDILPEVLPAGKEAGVLTEEGARFLDPSGTFLPGVSLVPPEGDMGTGMVATNSVRLHTGNASIGTSSNLTIVTGKVLPPDPRIDIIAGPSGTTAALIHVNNGTTDINAWVNLVAESIELGGGHISKGELYEKLFNLALGSDPLCGGLLQYNTASGEPILGINEGRPMLLRSPDAKLTLANLTRANIYAVFGAIRCGLDILEAQGVSVDKVTGHGGFFKTRGVGSKLLSAAIKAPVVNLYSSSEGGPYGMALLASYYLEAKEGEDLADYLDAVFASSKQEEWMASETEIADFAAYQSRYVGSLPALKEAIEDFKI